MRPITKGTPKLYQAGRKSQEASGELLGTLGPYCSYCEENLGDNLEVEHIQPAALSPLSSNRWENYLLACRTCNASKGKKDVVLTMLLLPDRDNTFAAYCYAEDGRIHVRNSLSETEQDLAYATICLVNLNKTSRGSGKILTESYRLRQRMGAFLQAKLCREELVHVQSSRNADRAERMIDFIILQAKNLGYFSIWMEVFRRDAKVRRRLIDAFPGTERACFHPQTTDVVRPHPNHDQLDAGGKI